MQINHTYNLKQKEVIDISTCEKMGYIYDVDVDLETGKIKSFVIPKYSGLLHLFTKKQDYYIDWHDIVGIGKEIVLIKTKKTEEIPEITTDVN